MVDFSERQDFFPGTISWNSFELLRYDGERLVQQAKISDASEVNEYTLNALLVLLADSENRAASGVDFPWPEVFEAEDFFLPPPGYISCRERATRFIAQETRDEVSGATFQRLWSEEKIHNRYYRLTEDRVFRAAQVILGTAAEPPVFVRPESDWPAEDDSPTEEHTDSGSCQPQQDIGTQTSAVLNDISEEGDDRVDSLTESQERPVLCDHPPPFPYVTESAGGPRFREAAQKKRKARRRSTARGRRARRGDRQNRGRRGSQQNRGCCRRSSVRRARTARRRRRASSNRKRRTRR